MRADGRRLGYLVRAAAGLLVLLAAPGCPAIQSARDVPDDYPIEERYDRVFRHYLTPSEQNELGRTDVSGHWHPRLGGEERRRFIERAYRSYGLDARIELAILQHRLLLGMTQKQAELSVAKPPMTHRREKNEHGEEEFWLIYTEVWDSKFIARPKNYVVFNWNQNPEFRHVRDWHFEN